jgi:hypothetical protein
MPVTAPTYGKLGCIPSRPDARTLQFANFLLPNIPEPPPSRRWDIPIPQWGVMGNNDYGNCTIATAAHMIMCWRANESGLLDPIADAAVIELAREMGALEGFQIIDRLKYWRKNDMWANHLWAFAQVDQFNEQHTRIAINNHGALDIGLALPRRWQQTQIWDFGIGPGYRHASWGYHSVPIVGYDADYLYLITWGRVQRMTWPALQAYCEEAYVLIDPCWFEADGLCPAGLDLTALAAAVRAIATHGLE